MKVKISLDVLDVLFSQRYSMSMEEAAGLYGAVKEAKDKETLIHAIELAQFFSTVRAIDALQGVLEGEAAEYQLLRDASEVYRKERHNLYRWKRVYEVLTDEFPAMLRNVEETTPRNMMTFNPLLRLHRRLNNSKSEELLEGAIDDFVRDRSEDLWEKARIAKMGLKVLKGKARVKRIRAPRSLLRA